MATVIIFLLIIMISFTVFLEVQNIRNFKKHYKKVQLLEEIIRTLTVKKLSMKIKMKLMDEIDVILKSGKVKLMHDINELQHELFKIISQKN